MSDPIKPWASRLVEYSLMVLAAALMLHWAWALLRPLMPVLLTTTALAVTIVLLVNVVRWWQLRRWG